VVLENLARYLSHGWVVKIPGVGSGGVYMNYETYVGMMDV